MSGDRSPFVLRVQPWFQDHSVGGRIVLPAVETMLLLAARCKTVYPDRDVRVMANARFGKLLEIPANAVTVAVLVECVADTEGRVQAKLQSHIQLAAMARIKEHGEIFFPSVETNKELPPDIDPAPLTGTQKEFDSEQIYRDLVPFGRCYQTLRETLYLSGCQAWGTLHAPELPFIDPVQTVIGSPFPLDGAMHAACVLGQQFVDFAPFPVGFERRTIVRPTQPGGRYLTRVSMVSLAGDQLVFDLHIFNNAGQLFETVTGVRMRDVRQALKKQAVG